jgi:rare lipoprotein A
MFLCLFLSVCSAAAHTDERGIASYYAGKFQGRLTANGEIFDTNLYTAAHKTLPFNTIVRVTSAEKGKSVLVRINDRGPFVAGRVIDLSRAAAEAIDMVGSGLAGVSVEVVALGDGKTFHNSGPPRGRVSIQVGAFSSRENADEARRILEADGLASEMESGARGIIRVVVSDVPVGDLELMKLRLAGLGFPGVFVRRPN